jgi:hypothetical protein
MNQTKRLITYFSSLGTASFTPPDFSNPEDVRYAAIEIITRQPLADGLEEFVNSRLNLQNGFQASLHCIGLSSERKERYRFVIEIIPSQDLNSEEALSEATEHYLQSLPKVVRDFLLHRKARLN